jgi:hypothetical protein
MSVSRPKLVTIAPIYQGEAIVQPFTITTAGVDISGWTMGARVKSARGGTTLFQPTIAKTGAAAFTVSMTSAQTNRAAANYLIDIWRLDGGSEKTLAEGILPILSTTSPAGA